MNIGVQTAPLVARYGVKQAAKAIHDAGFTAIDWNIDHALTREELREAPVLRDLCIFEKPLEEVFAYYADELAAFRKYGLSISQAHAPFPCYFPGREDVLDYCIGIYRRCIEFCDAVGCKNLIVHGISVYPEDVTSVEKCAYYRELNLKLYRGLIDTVKNTSVTVCLENLFKTVPGDFYTGTCSDPHEAVEYIDTLNREAGKECFGLCLDTGHIHLLRMRFPLYVPVVGKRIKALHIHDNDAHADGHLMPYAGTIHWGEFLESMRTVGYEGDLCFETFAQAHKVPDALLPTFLSTIHETGVYFRNEITK